MYGSIGMGLDPTLAPVVDEPDFDDFIADRPGMLCRIQARLQQGKSLKGWLYEEYAKWKGWD